MAEKLSVDVLATTMLEAVMPILKKRWTEVGDYAKTEARKTAETLTLIATLYAAGKIDEKTAKAYVEIQKVSTQNVLLCIEGIGIIATQEAINAALAAIKAPVNAAIGFALL